VRAQTAPTINSNSAMRFCGFMISGQLAALMAGMELDQLA
jgi:hypothetical protein